MEDNPLRCQRFKPVTSQSGSAVHMTVWVRVFFSHFVDVRNNEVNGCKMLPASLSQSKKIIKSNDC